MRYRSYNNGPNFIWLGLLIFLLFGGFRTIFLIIPILFSLIPILIISFLLFTIIRLISKNSRIGSTIKFATVDRKRFVELLVHILVHALKADGRIDQRSVQIIKNFFRVQMRYSNSEMLWINDLIQTAIKTHVPLGSLCQEFYSQFPGEPRLILLELIYQISTSDGVITRAEQQVINEIISRLFISEQDHTRIKTHYVKHKAQSESHYETLGIQPGATREEIKKAYKEACKKYHPDKVQHLGEEFRKVAEEKIKQINNAYTELSKQSV